MADPDDIRDARINATVGDIASDLTDRCNDNIEDIISVVFGLVGHAVISFNIPNEVAHALLGSLLAQREDHDADPS